MGCIVEPKSVLANLSKEPNSRKCAAVLHGGLATCLQADQSPFTGSTTFAFGNADKLFFYVSPIRATDATLQKRQEVVLSCPCPGCLTTPVKQSEF
jgi:hypothetical protein